MNKDYSHIDQILDEIILGKGAANELAGNLDGEDREALLKDLPIHQSATSVVQRAAMINQVLDVHRTFMAKRNGFVKDEFRGTHVVNKFVSARVWWRIAAVLIIAPLLLFGYLYTTNSTNKLFNSQYQSYRINVDRSAINSKGTTLEEKYRDNHFSEVITLYENLENPGIREKMIAAFSYMELKRYDEAVPLLGAVIRNNVSTGSNLFQDEAEYYLALALLKTQKLEQSFQLFEKIHADNEHTFNRRVNRWFIIKLKWLR